ncbi:MAG: hypothetical protein JJU28_22810 [Cyclobacteriaceae bacterium]|nr:hypothetical protein [Cyclobacteriaceae bacterium]
MKKFIFVFVLFSCSGNSQNSKKESNTPDFVNIELTHIHVNQYQNDSLNLIRPYTLPILYFELKAINYSDENLTMVINSSDIDIEPQKLVAEFSYLGKLDTILIMDFETSKTFKFHSHDTTYFTVNGILHEKLNSNNSTNEIGVIKEIVSTVELYYLPSLFDTLYIEKSEIITDTIYIRKSSDFSITFRDPDDTTIE